MAETINCNEKFTKPQKPSQDDTRKEDGQFQSTSDWMRNGGKKPGIVIKP